MRTRITAVFGALSSPHVDPKFFRAVLRGKDTAGIEREEIRPLSHSGTLELFSEVLTGGSITIRPETFDERCERMAIERAERLQSWPHALFCSAAPSYLKIRDAARAKRAKRAKKRKA